MEIVKSMYNHRIIKPSFQPFITIWDTTQAGIGDNSIQILTNGAGYDCRVYWGDGTANSYSGSSPVIYHNYTTAGTYQVEIYGKFPIIYMSNNANYRSKLIEVKQWGDIEWGSSLQHAFLGCNNLELTAKDTPNLTNTTPLFGMFRACALLKGDNTNWNWNTSNVTDMSYMFFQAGNFDGDIGNWNTSNVTNMSSMFEQATSFNQDIGGWDTGNVTSMVSMFENAKLFNGDITTWDTSQVTNMSRMFRGFNIAYIMAFNQDISGWDTSQVTDMTDMFRYCQSFNQPIWKWDFTNVTSLGEFLNLNAGAMSTANYDLLLQNWANNSTLRARGLTVSCGSSKYTSAGAGGAARTSLINNYGWTITDGGGI